MNKCTIIGNLVRDPELIATMNGAVFCRFTVAVNRRRNGQQEAEYFDVLAWEKLGELCDEYLAKGRKVAVCGRVSARAWIGKRDGSAHASLEINAEEVEFLSPRNDGAVPADSGEADTFTEVDNEEVPF